MSYCTAQDMIDRFSEAELILLTDKQNVGLIDSVVLEQAINDAGAEIDGYLSRYTLPLSPVPTVLVRSCCDIARYYLYDDAMIDIVEKRYLAVTAYLLQVAKGAISLGVDNTGAAPISNNSAHMQSDGHVFRRADKGFI
ncbi:MAG: DUF1320 family protein [Methyloprofundus sp.]|nr:DUF1320 family protein [Methyloprofundus sp.]